MMLRKYFDKKDNLRYDPVTIFRELKNLFDKKQFDIYKLGCLIQNLKTTQHNHKQIIAELKNEMKMSKLKYISLKKKAERQFRVDKASTKGRLRELTQRKKTIKKKQLPILSNRPSTSIDPKKKLFITSDGRKYKKQNQSIEENKELKLKDESDNESSDTSEVDSSNESKEEEESKDESSRLVLEEESFDEKEIKRFRDLKISKNRDKLIRSNGFKGMDNIISGLKNLADRTNRILYYKTQSNFSDNKTSDTIKKDNVKSRTHSIGDKKQIDESEHIYNQLSFNVMKKLNKMISDAKK